MTECKLIKNTDDNTTEIEVIEIEGYKIGTYEVEYIERIKGLYGFVYVTTNLVNGKMYVGQRKIKYKNKNNSWKTYLGSGKLLKAAIKKHGKEKFRRKIIDIAFNQEELNSLEYYYTKVFNSVDNDQWYNLHYGGEVGYKMHYNLSEEGRKNQLKHHPWKGKHHTEETKEKMRKAAKLREENKKKNNYQVSEETRKKLSQAGKGRESKKKKKVNQYDMDGTYIKTWDCPIDAANELNIDLCTLRLAASGKYKSAGGFQWKYCDNVNDTKNIKPYQKAIRKDKGIRRSNKMPYVKKTKEEISAIRSKQNSIRINQYTADNLYVRTYDSAQQAHDLDGHNVGSIRQCCKHKMKTHHGFKWFDADDPNQPDKTKIILKEE